jgi:multiple sugar transport system substrate-binding protein
MNNRFKQILSVLIIAALMFTIACGGNDEKDPNGNPDETTDRNPDNEPLARCDFVIERAAQLVVEQADALPNVEVKQKIKLMSWYNPDETSPASETFRARYGVPGQQNDDDFAVIEWNRVVYAVRYDRLATAIVGGNSPDMFQFEERYYPWGVYDNAVYETIDGIIDLDGPEWDATRDIIELFQWGGQNFAPVTELNNSSSLLWYRKSIVQAAGLKDPYDLWMNDEWTWVEFEDMLKRYTDPGNKKWGIMGWYIDESAILTTGTPIIGLENGRLVNNLDNTNVERAMGLLENLARHDLRYPYHTENDNELDRERWRSGDILFWVDGTWEFQQYMKHRILNDNWSHAEIAVVPFPRDPQSDTYYQRGKQDAMMLVKGAQNIDGYKAWIQSSVIAAQDAEMNRLGREKMMRDHEYTEHLLDTLEKIRELTPVWDFKNGIGTDIADATIDSFVENLTKPVIIQGEKTYAQVRDENRGPIDARIIQMNAWLDR